MRTTTLDESSIDGNIAVVRNIYVDQLKFGLNDLDNHAVPCINDQSTNARVCSAQTLPSNDTCSINHLDSIQLGPGCFHIELNLLWAILNTHRGNLSDAGSLSYYMSLLDVSRLGSEHPDYQTLLSFCWLVLNGNLLHCWLTESGFNSVEEFARSKPSSQKLLELAAQILKKHASQTGLQACNETNTGNFDGIKRNAILLNWDLLIFFELISAISSGDFG